MLGLGISTLKRGAGFSVTISLNVPQDLSLSESTISEVTVSWSDVAETVDGYKVYRRVTSVGGSWGTALGAISESVETYTDSTVAGDTQYDYKVVAYIGTNETTEENFGENYLLITTLAQIQGLLFADGDRLAYPSAKTYTGLFNIQMGIQGLTDSSGSTGLIGSVGGSSNRILLSSSLNKIRANIAGGSLLSSGTLTPTLDLSGRRVIEIYRDASNDVYFVDGVNSAQLLFNKAGDFVIDSVFVTGGFGSAGYLYYLNDGDQEFLFDEGSGSTVTSTDSAVALTVTTTGDTTYINNTMWTSIIPAPAGYVFFTSLSAGGRPTPVVNNILSVAPTDYTAGSADFQIASMYNIGNHNPDGWTHVIITTGTNDIANTSNFATPDEYETALTSIVQKLKTAGIVPIIAFTGTMVTSIKQAEKDYDSTIGAMLSGDALNPTPESGWDFNVASTGVASVIPLYVIKGKAVALAETVGYVDTFQHFIDGQSAPYSTWISTDGIHYTSVGYFQYGTVVTTYLNTLSFSGSEKVAVLGDSLGNGIATDIQSQFNS